MRNKANDSIFKIYLMSNNIHTNFMQKCIKLAKIARQRGESPVGSIIVLDGEIIGQGIEGVKSHNDITYHAEVEAIRDASSYLGHRNLSACTLYTSHEPCIMCSYIIRQTGISIVVIGELTGDTGGYSSALPVLKDVTVQKWAVPPEILIYPGYPPPLEN